MFHFKSFNILLKNCSIINFKKYYSMELKKVVQCLNEYAPKELACDWDNVGLLVEPSNPDLVKKILITNDLTEPVLNESIKLGVNLIISYHPSIFYPLKRLTQSEWKQKSIIKLIENRIALYSPHTTWDSVNGGMNDWLINLFDPKTVEPVTTIKSSSYPTEKGTGLNVKFNLIESEELKSELKKIETEELRLIRSHENLNSHEYEFVCNEKSLIVLLDLIRSKFPQETYKSLRITNLEKPPLVNTGLARLGVLKEEKSIREVVEKLKLATNLKHVRLALANGKTIDDKINSIVCGAGSGSKLLNNTKADLIITGEFAHHEILNETHRGVSVILTDHTNNERCYFGHFKQEFGKLLAKNGGESIEMIISKSDRDPLETI